MCFEFGASDVHGQPITYHLLWVRSRQMSVGPSGLLSPETRAPCRAKAARVPKRPSCRVYQMLAGRGRLPAPTLSLDSMSHDDGVDGPSIYLSIV